MNRFDHNKWIKDYKARPRVNEAAGPKKGYIAVYRVMGQDFTVGPLMTNNKQEILDMLGNVIQGGFRLIDVVPASQFKGVEQYGGLMLNNVNESMCESCGGACGPNGVCESCGAKHESVTEATDTYDKKTVTRAFIKGHHAGVHQGMYGGDNIQAEWDEFRKEMNIKESVTEATDTMDLQSLMSDYMEEVNRVAEEVRDLEMYVAGGIDRYAEETGDYRLDQVRNQTARYIQSSERNLDALIKMLKRTKKFNV